MKHYITISAGLLAVLATCVVLFVLQTEQRSHSTVDWLASNDWSRMAGAEKQGDSTYFSYVGRVINHTDTSDAQPNPPVNVRGSHLKVSDNFEIDFSMTGIHQTATVQFYGEVPVIYDEWRQERGSVRVEVSPRSIIMKVWDGSAANAIDQREFAVDLKEDQAEMRLVHHEDQLSLHVTGRQLGIMPAHGIFDSKQVWFGAETKEGSAGWHLTSLHASALGDSQLELIQPVNLSETITTNEPTLKKAAASHPRKLPIGAAISVNPLLTDERYRTLALSQFSMMTPENSFKPQAIQPERNLYTFQDTDSLIEAAEANNMIVHGHSLVMGKATPEWMQRSEEAERRQIMTDHIKTIMSRYKGKVAQWDVVNEPLSEDGIDYKNGGNGLRKHIWSEAMGEDYIAIAHRAAHEADPDAKIFLNDFGMENDGERWDTMLALVKKLQSQGVPVHGVGFEAHVYHEPADTINTDSLRRHIRQLAEIGIESRISEIDVLDDDLDFQSSQYGDVLAVCLSEPTCTSYGIWGVSDLYGSTTLSDRYPIRHGGSLLWDLEYKPKPAYQRLLETLSNR